MTMKDTTKKTLTERATTLLGEHPNNPQAAHSIFVKECAQSFESNPEGLSREDYNATTQSIWDQAKAQQGARPGQQSNQQQQARR